MPQRTTTLRVRKVSHRKESHPDGAHSANARRLNEPVTGAALGRSSSGNGPLGEHDIAGNDPLLTLGRPRCPCNPSATAITTCNRASKRSDYAQVPPGSPQPAEPATPQLAQRTLDHTDERNMLHDNEIEKTITPEGTTHMNEGHYRTHCRRCTSMSMTDRGSRHSDTTTSTSTNTTGAPAPPPQPLRRSPTAALFLVAISRTPQLRAARPVDRSILAPTISC
ncbi:hypothetical protein GA0061093_11777 [Rhodococcus qingshengii]|nr:hypothetical protein GA0061093_11777 [Rhodococcus qingshengii]